MGGLAGTFFDVMARGGVTMWPLLGLSVVSVSLILERALYWWRTNGRAGRSEVARLADALRRGDRAAVEAIAAARGSSYGRFAAAISTRGYSEAIAIEAIEAQRPEIDRFMVILSTVITAAPMLGILGTVLGIIQSFELLGGENILTDPKEVSAGIAEALITTASGLTVALLTLFPFMAFKAQSERALGRMEALAAAAAQGHASSKPGA
ncbi:MAG: MotA/TolQ/ExbB proton channel family protein [Phycisphaerales bacterium]|jgi:biopolymer transport protein ExbB